MYVNVHVQVYIYVEWLNKVKSTMYTRHVEQSLLAINNVVCKRKFTCIHVRMVLWGAACIISIVQYSISLLL